MATRSDPPIKPRPRASASHGMIFAKRNSSLYLREQQRKAARYEAMVQWFQLRRVDNLSASNVLSKFTSKDLIIDTRLVGGRSTRNGYQRLSFRRLTRKLSRRAIKSAGGISSLTDPFLSSSIPATIHGIAMICAYHFQIFYLPFAPIFYPSGSLGTTTVNITLEALFLFDIVMNFNTVHVPKTPATPITSRRGIARHYIKSWFLFDLIAAFPVQTIKLTLGGSHAMAIDPGFVHGTPRIMMRLFRHWIRGDAHQISHRLVRWARYSRYSHLLGIVRLLWLVIIVAHYMACFWHLLDHHPATTDLTVGEQYVANYYYAVTLIHGQGNLSTEWGQNLFSTAVVLIGSVIVATVFGNVAMLVSNFNASAINYQRKMEDVFATMDKMELPDRLRDRIQQYYAHVWAEYESLDGDLVKFQRELTHTLGLEVGLYKYMGLVNDIPFWADCSPDFIAQIVLTLVVRVYLPDDFVVRQGEICDEMYMINRGVCEVTRTESVQFDGNPESETRRGVGDQQGLCSTTWVRTPRTWSTSTKATTRLGSSNSRAQVLPEPWRSAFASSTTTATIHPGQSFSEMSLIMNYQQPESARATSFVEMCVLERRSFQSIIARFPQDRRRVLSCMLKSCIEKKEAPPEWLRQCTARSVREQPDRKTNERVTAAEMAEILVDQIDVELPDETIKYGFQHGAVAEKANPTATEATSSSSYNDKTSGTPCATTGNSDCSGQSSGGDASLASTLQALTAAVCRVDATIDQIKSELSILVLTRRYDSANAAASSCNACAARFGLDNISESSALALQPPGHDALRIVKPAPLSRASPTNAFRPSRAGLSVYDRSLSQSPPVASPVGSANFDDSCGALGQSFPSFSASNAQLVSTEVNFPSHPLAGSDLGAAHAMLAATGAADWLIPLSHPPSSRFRSDHRPSSTAATARVPTRSKTSVAPREGKKGRFTTTSPLRKRFLNSRLSNPSYATGSSWAPPANTDHPRVGQDQEVTLTDQLWQRRFSNPGRYGVRDDRKATLVVVSPSIGAAPPALTSVAAVADPRTSVRSPNDVESAPTRVTD